MGNPAVPISLCYTGVSGNATQGVKSRAHSQFVPRDVDISSTVGRNFSVRSLPDLQSPPPLKSLLAPWMGFFSRPTFSLSNANIKQKNQKVAKAHTAAMGGTAVRGILDGEEVIGVAVLS